MGSDRSSISLLFSFRSLIRFELPPLDRPVLSSTSGFHSLLLILLPPFVLNACRLPFDTFTTGESDGEPVSLFRLLFSLKWSSLLLRFGLFDCLPVVWKESKLVR